MTKIIVYLSYLFAQLGVFNIIKKRMLLQQQPLWKYKIQNLINMRFSHLAAYWL